MRIEFRTEPLTHVPTSALVVFGFEGLPASSGTAARLPSEVRAALEELHAARELTGKNYECTLLHRPAGLAAQKLLVVGAGKKEKFSAAHLRRLAGCAGRYLRARGIHELAWVLESNGAEPKAVQAIVEGAILADYDGDRYRTEREGERRIDFLSLATGGGTPGESIQAALERARIIAEAQNFTQIWSTSHPTG